MGKTKIRNKSRFSISANLLIFFSIIIIIMVIFKRLSLRTQALYKIVKEEGGRGNKIITQMFLSDSK